MNQRDDGKEGRWHAPTLMEAAMIVESVSIPYENTSADAAEQLRALAASQPSAQDRSAVHYERFSAMDKRISRGDDFAGDAWVRWVAVGQNPNNAGGQVSPKEQVEGKGATIPPSASPAPDSGQTPATSWEEGLPEIFGRSPATKVGIATEPLISGSSTEVKPDERGKCNKAPVGEDRNRDDLARSDAIFAGSAESRSCAASGKANEVATKAAPQEPTQHMANPVSDSPTPAAAAPINASNHSAAGVLESPVPAPSEPGHGGVAPIRSAPSEAPASETPTPETDSLIQDGPFCGPEYWVNQWDKAINSHRKLERERDEARRELVEEREKHTATFEAAKELRRLIDAAEASLARLRAVRVSEEALKIVYCLRSERTLPGDSYLLLAGEVDTLVDEILRLHEELKKADHD